MKIDQCVFVVTGGASGLGEAVVRMAAAHNGKVAIFDMNQKKGNALVAELGEDKVMFLKVNVTSDKSVDEAFAAVIEKFGGVHVVVNSAGVAGASLTVNRKGEAHAVAGFQRIVDINLKGSFLVASRAAALMAKQEPNADGERGLIVFISSVAATDGQNGQVAYSASKAGVIGMTLPMARDLAKYGIRVNAIQPGIFDTPMGGAKKPVDNREVEKLNPIQANLLKAQVFPSTRFGRPTELGLLVKAMTEIPFLNAEHIRLDAGVRMGKL